MTRRTTCVEQLAKHPVSIVSRETYFSRSRVKAGRNTQAGWAGSESSACRAVVPTD